MPGRRWMVCSDVGGTKLATAVVSSQGELRRCREEPTDQRGATASCEQLVRMYRAAVIDVAPEEVAGWGLSVPGIWDARQRKVWAPNIAGWDWLSLADLLEQSAHTPVLVASDRTAALLGEKWKGCAVGCSDFLYLIVGTGIGVGALCGDVVVEGAHAVGGAVGWFQLPALFGEQASPQSWEALAAGPAVARRYQAHTGKSLDSESVFEHAAVGEHAAKAVVDETAVYLGLGICNLIAAFDPELIVIGGGLAAGFELMRQTVQDTIGRHGQPVSSKHVRLNISQIGGAGPLLGMAALGFGVSGAGRRD